MTFPTTPRDAARFYRDRGWNPLPSRADAKRPDLPSYAAYWISPIGTEILDRWMAPNIQLMCGVHWGLAVVDLDGPEAADAWQAMTLYRPCPLTWTVRTGGGGLHLYFRVPSFIREMPSRCVWEGSGRHQRIEILGDRSLVIAPPSVHVDTGRAYEFLVGPDDLSQPAMLPRWLTRAKAVPSQPPKTFWVATAPVVPCVPTGGKTYDRKAVLRAIPDKLSLVRSWGLRVRGWIPNVSGWLPCHALGRVDHKVSAGFHVSTGYYCEPPRWRVSLFDVAVLLGIYPDWCSAVNGLGSAYLSCGA
jgi:hypothetical protein